MLNTDNRMLVIKYIDKAISDAYAIGYRLDLNAPLVDPYLRTCCPIGAVLLTRKNNPFTNRWMAVFMKAYEGRVHKDVNRETMAHNVGAAYRKFMLKPNG